MMCSNCNIQLKKSQTLNKIIYTCEECEEVVTIESKVPNLIDFNRLIVKLIQDNSNNKFIKRLA